MIYILLFNSLYCVCVVSVHTWVFPAKQIPAELDARCQSRLYTTSWAKVCSWVSVCQDKKRRPNSLQLHKLLQKSSADSRAGARSLAGKQKPMKLGWNADLKDKYSCITTSKLRPIAAAVPFLLSAPPYSTFSWLLCLFSGSATSSTGRP